MTLEHQRIQYHIETLSDMYYMEDTLIFSYHIEYLLYDTAIGGFVSRNNRNLRQAQVQQSYAVNTAYEKALRSYLEGTLTIPYEYRVSITVTMNASFVFSHYVDTYSYLGELQGYTIRTSFTDDTRNGQSRGICSFMSQQGCLTCISNTIVQQIQNSEQIERYFPNYETLVPQTFEISDFYVVPEGVIVFFGIEEIAPYSEGIITFTIPFNAC